MNIRLADQNFVLVPDKATVDETTIMITDSSMAVGHTNIYTLSTNTASSMVVQFQLGYRKENFCSKLISLWKYHKDSADHRPKKTELMAQSSDNDISNSDCCKICNYYINIIKRLHKLIICSTKAWACRLIELSLNMKNIKEIES